MIDIPQRRQNNLQPPKPKASIFAPASGANATFYSGSLPVDPEEAPDCLPDQTPKDVAINDPESSGRTGNVPDGWLDRRHAQELLSLAGIDLDSRRIRHLCARNDLENVKAKNERNQPQYFINPTSLDDYIAKNRPDGISGTRQQVPDQHPDKLPERFTKQVLETNPIRSEHHAKSIAKSVGQGPEGEWVPREQYDQVIRQMEFLQDEVRHARTYKSDTAQIANRMLETLETMAVGGRLAAPERTEPTHKDVHETNARVQDIQPHNGV